MSGCAGWSSLDQTDIGAPHPALLQGRETAEDRQGALQQARVVLCAPKHTVEGIAARSETEASDSAQSTDTGAALAWVEVGDERPPMVGLRDHGRFFLVGHAGRCRSRDFELA